MSRLSLVPSLATNFLCLLTGFAAAKYALGKEDTPRWDQRTALIPIDKRSIHGTLENGSKAQVVAIEDDGSSPCQIAALRVQILAAARFPAVKVELTKLPLFVHDALGKDRRVEFWPDDASRSLRPCVHTPRVNYGQGL